MVFKLLLLVVLAGVGYYAYTTFMAPPASTTANANRPVTVGPTRAVPTAATGEVTLEITQESLTTELNSRLTGQSLGMTPLGEASLKEARVTLQNGGITITGNAQSGPATVGISTTGTISAQDGKAVASVNELKVAGITLPDSARKAVEQQLQRQLDSSVNRPDIRISSVTVADGKLVVVGGRRN